MASGAVSCPLGISMDNCTAIAAAATTDISNLIYEGDTPPTPIDTSVLPPNLKTKLQECDGDGTTPCKLVMYDFKTNTGTTANSADYLIQLESGSRTADNSMVAVLSNVNNNVNTTSLGIPTDNLDLHYDQNHLTLTPAIASGPIGFSSIGATIQGSGTSVTASSIDGCATACDASSTCGGFNFSESSTCTLFNIVDKDFTVSTRYDGSNGQQIQTLTLTLNGSTTGVTSGQTVTGLETYINGPVQITDTGANSITIKFDEQVVYQVPANTQITISAGRLVDPDATVHGYTSNKTRINLIGVNGTMSYGYSGDFTVSQQLNGLPTNIGPSTAIQPSSTSVTQLALTFASLPSPLPTISSATLSMDVSGTPPTSNVVMINDPTNCNPALTTVTDACKAVFSSNTVSGNTITFDLPSGGGFVRNAIDSSVKIYFTTTDFTLNVTTGTPSDRIMGWSGTLSLFPITVTIATSTSITASFPVVSGINPPVVGMTGTVGSYPITVKTVGLSTITADITIPSVSTPPSVNATGLLGIFPVTVVRFTNSTITFSGPSIIPSTGVRAQTIKLSDNNGSTCQDIKACNASIQRLLDNNAIRSFSTLDLVACSACPERAYKKPATSQSADQFNKLREYLWYGNSGRFSCSASLPTGASSFDENCTPVCTPSTDQNALSTEYDASTSACRITCRTGYRWDSTSKTCVACPSVTLDPQTTYTYTNGCVGTCRYTGSTTNLVVTTVSDANGYLTGCTRTCNNGYLPSSDYSQCCDKNAQPLGTQVASITSTNCSTVTCAKDTSYDLNYASVGASGGTCTFTCGTVGTIPVGTNNGTTATVSTATGLSSELIFPVYWNGTALATVSSAPTSSTTLKTNIGTYTFGNSAVGPGMYIGNSGTPSTYYAMSIPVSIGFPLFFQLTGLEYWLSPGSTVSSVNVKLFDSKNEGNSVLNYNITSGTSATFSTVVYARRIEINFVSGSGSIAYRIKGKVLQNCSVRCTYSGTSPNGGSPVYNDTSKTCSMDCPTGFSGSNGGCSSCTAVTVDPGTQVSFNSSCDGTCAVASGQPASTTVYAGTQTASITITAAATGAERYCHINACPTGYTKYTNSGTTTSINNGGCCQTPIIVDSSNKTLTLSGASWSYPPLLGSSGSACNLTCTLPATNTYNMTLTVDNTNKKCTRACPSVTAGAGTTVGTVSDNCNPNCTTTDSNATAAPVYTTSASTVTGVCTKTCNSGYKGDTGATPNTTTSTPGSKPCCSYVGSTGNTTVTLSNGTTCKATNAICSVTTNYANINTAVYNAAAAAGSTPTCTIQCKTVTLNPSSGAGLSSSYSLNGQCALTCSSTVTNSAPTKTDASGATAPQCTFACASNYYKPTSAYLCCPNITESTGTLPNKSTTDCTFTCGLNGSSYPSTLYTSSVSGRSCILGCVSGVAYQPTGYTNKCCSIPTVPSGVNYNSNPTPDDPCTFTCSKYNGDPNRIVEANQIARTCVLGGCASGYTLVGSTCTQNRVTGYNYYICANIQSPLLNGLLSSPVRQFVAYKRLYMGPQGTGTVAAGGTKNLSDFTIYFGSPNTMYSCPPGYSFRYYNDDNSWWCTLDQFLTNNNIYIYIDSVTDGLFC